MVNALIIYPALFTRTFDCGHIDKTNQLLFMNNAGYSYIQYLNFQGCSFQKSPFKSSVNNLFSIIG